MKLILSFFIILSILLVFPPPLRAHIAGQPPFFKINDKYADYYPVYSTSLSDFTLPQDLAPENYLINEQIQFEIDTKMLPFPPEIIEQITYTWDFGDGTTGEGTINTHTYTQPGSYLLTVNADYGEYSDPNTKPVLQAVLLHILPDSSYKLPQIAIKINDTVITDPLIDTVTFPSGETLQFDVSVTQGTSPIVSYFWDRGDGTSIEEKQFSYNYTLEDPAYIFPFVRVVDKNGFIVDTYAQIENNTDNQTTSSSWLGNNIFLVLIVVNLLLLGGGGYFLFKKR